MNAQRGIDPTWNLARCEAELTASKQREAELEKRLAEAIEHEKQTCEVADNLYKKLEAAEDRIKASQEKAPVYHLWYRDGVWCPAHATAKDELRPVYAQPIIPPELAELQRENAEPRKLLEEAKSKAVPEGWQLVPKIPTFHMCAVDCDFGVFIGIDTARQIYEAMLAAAPQPKEPKQC